MSESQKYKTVCTTTKEDIKNPHAIEEWKHFNNWTILRIHQEVLKQRLKDRENYWVKKLKTLKPFGLNQELN